MSDSVNGSIGHKVLNTSWESVTVNHSAVDLAGIMPISDGWVRQIIQLTSKSESH